MSENSVIKTPPNVRADDVTDVSKFTAAIMAETDALQKHPVPNGSTSSQSTTQTEEGQQGWSPEMARDLSRELLGFTLVITLVVTALLWKKQITGAQIIRLYLLILIVCLAAYLVVVGYGDRQLTPIIGLFGAISGYLLGKDSGQAASAPPPAAPKDGPARNE